MKVCPKCSAEFEDHVDFCRVDGVALRSKAVGRVCPRCGSETEEGKKFCRNCGANLEQRKEPLLERTVEIAMPIEEDTDRSKLGRASLVKRGEDYLREKNYENAISTLAEVLKDNPQDQEAYLLHLYASVKLYNIYGYERQIESLKELSNLTKKEREIVRDIFLIRSEEAQRRRKQDEAREYQQLARRVIFGRPLSSGADIALVKKEEALTKKVEVQSPPPKAERLSPTRPAMGLGKTSNLPQIQVAHGGRKPTSRLFISLVLVFGLAVVLMAGTLFYYAKQKGVEITDLIRGKSPSAPQPAPTPAPPPSTPTVAQVLSREDLGFKVSGEGATDPNRQPSVISRWIDSHLESLRELYKQRVQQKTDLMGRMTLQLTISGSGMVTKVNEVASRIKDDDFKQAVIQEAYKWRFPEANSGLVKIDYPLLFVPPGMDVASLVRWEQAQGTSDAEPTAPKTASPADEQPAEPGITAGPTRTTPKGASSPRPKSKGRTGSYEVVSPTSVYSEPREDSQSVASIEAGTKVNVVGVQGDWLEIRSKYGRPPGFIKKDSAVLR